MKKAKLNLSLYQILLLIIYLVLFFAVIYTPHLISGAIHITKRLILEEEITEGSLLGVLFLLNIFLLNLYRNETARQKELINKINSDKKSVEDKLEESFRYIGQVNVQLQQIKSIFNEKDRFPETKNDFKKTLFYFSERVFGIVDAKWVLFRVIDCNTHKTIKEQFEIRKGYDADYPHVSNKMIIEGRCCPPFTTLISNPQNLNVFVCCILPVDKVSNDERVFIQAIVNEVTMLFVILNSAYYKKTSNDLTSWIAEKGNKVPNPEHE
jgi:hypothetical protein